MRLILALPIILAAAAGSSSAATIVNLLEVDAYYDQTGGDPLTTPASNPANINAGLTINVTFTPNSTDIGELGGAIALVEIGGNANGTGLYLLGGELHFLGKMQGAAGDVVTSFNDLDYSSGNNMIGVKSAFGQLSADTEYSVAVLYDPLGATPTLTLGVKPTGGGLATESYTLTGVGAKNNWYGNRTITSFRTPLNAGAGTTNTGSPWREGTGFMKDLSGTAGRALLWNAQGTIVPEPSSLSLLALCGIFLLRRTRR
ncbi:hypothetical protein HZ994_14020 [Akkermansiaceae bacterium]|nr:hypothetical protein HZ994_14020 [Akkermansiaceae bacterium]